MRVLRDVVTHFLKVTELATFFGDKTVRLRRDNYFDLLHLYMTLEIK